MKYFACEHKEKPSITSILQKHDKMMQKFIFSYVACTIGKCWNIQDFKDLKEFTAKVSCPWAKYVSWGVIFEGIHT